MVKYEKMKTQNNFLFLNAMVNYFNEIQISARHSVKTLVVYIWVYILYIYSPFLLSSIICSVSLYFYHFQSQTLLLVLSNYLNIKILTVSICFRTWILIGIFSHSQLFMPPALKMGGIKKCLCPCLCASDFVSAPYLIKYKGY